MIINGRRCIKKDLNGVGCHGVGNIHMAQHRVQWQAVLNILMHLKVPEDLENVLSIWLRTYMPVKKGSTPLS
jgi:hypothetical protein